MHTYTNTQICRHSYKHYYTCLTIFGFHVNGSHYLAQLNTEISVVHVVFINFGQLSSYLGTSGTRTTKNSTGHLETHMALNRGVSMERLYVIMFLCLYGELEGRRGRELLPEEDVIHQTFCQTSGKHNSSTCVPVDEAAQDRRVRGRRLSDKHGVLRSNTRTLLKWSRIPIRVDTCINHFLLLLPL